MHETAKVSMRKKMKKLQEPQFSAIYNRAFVRAVSKRTPRERARLADSIALLPHNIERPEAEIDGYTFNIIGPQKLIWAGSRGGIRGEIRDSE